MTEVLSFNQINPRKGRDQTYSIAPQVTKKAETLDLFEVKNIPTAFFVDKKRKIVGKAIGLTDWKGVEVVSRQNL